MRAPVARHTLIAAAVAMVVVVLGGLVLATRPNPDAPQGAHPASTSDHPDPVTGSSEIAKSGADVPSATAAAAAAVRSSGAVATAGPLTRRDLVLAMATDEYGPRLEDAVNRDIDELVVGLGERGLGPGDLLWAEYPLTATATLDGHGRADVRVWSVLVIGVEGGSVARQLWRTSDITLDWDGDTWRVADWTTTAGPSPALSGEADVATVAAVDTTTRWDAVGVGS